MFADVQMSSWMFIHVHRGRRTSWRVPLTARRWKLMISVLFSPVFYF
jgi:hypothetical protein